MTTTELVTIVFENLQPDQTAEFATELRQKIEESHTAEDAKIILDQLATAGITVTGTLCDKKRPQ